MKDHSKIIHAIHNSGYLVEQKVVNFFEEHGFYGGGNYSFKDQDELKSREVDFIATRYKDYKKRRTGFYFYTYGEVKKRKDPLIFFEREPHYNDVLEIYVPTIATNEFFSYIDLRRTIKTELDFSKSHHQMQHGLISTQFCVVDEKNKASHQNLYDSLFVPLLKCLDSEYKAITKATEIFNPFDPSFYLHVLHPVIVISGPLYSYNVHTDVLEEKPYIIYRRQHSSSTVTRSLLIDVVQADYLNTYLSEKLVKTYENIESNLELKLEQLIDLSYMNRSLQDKKIKESLVRHGYGV